MHRLNIYNLLAAAAVAMSAGLCLAWLCGWLFLDNSLGFRIAGLAVAALIAAVALFALKRMQQTEHRAAARYFDALSRLVQQGSYDDSNESALPSLPQDSQLREVAQSLHDALMRVLRKADDLQQNQASLEIRYRRATAKAEQMCQIISAMDDPILVIDDYDEVVLANQSAKDVLQIGDENLASKSLAKIVQCQKLIQLLTSTRQRKSSTQRSDEIEIPRGEGKSQWYQATAVKLASEGQDDKTSSGTVAVLHDIGDRKALQKRNAEFVSSVSHEMKTPLAGIKAYVELLADGDAEDEATREEFLGVINGQTDRLQRLVDNLLNLARIEAGVVSVSKQQRSLNEILEEALRVVQPSAEAKNIVLTGELSPLYLGVFADRDLMLQAAINLLSNAVKYTPAGGRVTLRSRMADDRIRFEVQDTGVGLSEDDCRRVFEKFYRVKKDKDMAQGTGLGLPLAKHIVEDVHGGQLIVESTLGKGSTFIVSIPCAGKD